MHIKEINAIRVADQIHFHNGYEIAIILKGIGPRIVGDNFEYFTGGDFTMLGSNLPHATYTDQQHVSEFGVDVHARVVYFQPDWADWAHMASPDFAPLEEMGSGGQSVSRLGRRAGMG